MASAPGRWHTQSSSKATNRWGDFIWLWPEGVCPLTHKQPCKDRRTNANTNTRPLLHLHARATCTWTPPVLSFPPSPTCTYTNTCTPGMSQGWRGARGSGEGQTFPQVSDCQGCKWAAQNNRLAPLTLNLVRVFHPQAATSALLFWTLIWPKGWQLHHKKLNHGGYLKALSMSGKKIFVDFHDVLN